MPWPTSAAQSVVEAPATYRAAAGTAGFEILATRDRGDYIRVFFDQLAARMRDGGPPPFSVALTMGDRTAEKVANMVASLGNGRIAPYEMICRKPTG